MPELELELDCDDLGFIALPILLMQYSLQVNVHTNLSGLDDHNCVRESDRTIVALSPGLRRLCSTSHSLFAVSIEVHQVQRF